MSHKDGRVVLSAWVDPVLRDYVREAARMSGLEFSRWVERAVRQTMARESADRAMVAALIYFGPRPFLFCHEFQDVGEVRVCR